MNRIIARISHDCYNKCEPIDNDPLERILNGFQVEEPYYRSAAGNSGHRWMEDIEMKARAGRRALIR